MADLSEKEQDLFDKMCEAADAYADGIIEGDELRSFVVDFTDAVKLSQVEPPHDENHYRNHTPANPDPGCDNCAYIGWSRQ